MSTTSSPHASPRALPVRPNIEFLKNEAKRRLSALRAGEPGLKLSAVQFDLAREYGFTSWRALKTAFEQPSPLILEAAGDWIGTLQHGTRVALHVRPDGATMDSPDYGSFGFRVADFAAGGGRMRFTLPNINVAFQGDWDEEADQWRGRWRQDGLEQPLAFARGVFPPAPVVDGLDGVWEGLVGDGGVRLIFRIWTTAHGTHALCDSPDRSGTNIPLALLERDGDAVVLTVKTARFEGVMAADGDRLEGRYIRGETILPLNLQRRNPGDAPLARPAVPVSGADLAACAGRYRFDGGDQEVEIAADGQNLSARFSDGRTIGLVPMSAREFRLQQGVGQMTFDAGPDGGIAGLTLRSYSRHSQAVRVG